MFQLRGHRVRTRRVSWADAARAEALEVVRATLVSDDTDLLGNHTGECRVVSLNIPGNWKLSCVHQPPTVQAERETRKFHLLKRHE